MRGVEQEQARCLGWLSFAGDKAVAGRDDRKVMGLLE